MDNYFLRGWCGSNPKLNKKVLCPISSMERIRVFDTQDVGSIPAWGTININNNRRLKMIEPITVPFSIMVRKGNLN